MAGGKPVVDTGWGFVVYHRESDGVWRVARDAFGPDHPPVAQWRSDCRSGRLPHFGLIGSGPISNRRRPSPGRTGRINGHSLERTSTARTDTRTRRAR